MNSRRILVATATIALVTAGCSAPTSGVVPEPPGDHLAELVDLYGLDTGDPYCDLMVVLDAVEHKNAEATGAVNDAFARLNQTGSAEDLEAARIAGLALWEIGLVRSELAAQVLTIVEGHEVTDDVAFMKAANDEFTVVMGQTVAQATSPRALAAEVEALLVHPDTVAFFEGQSGSLEAIGSFNETRCGISQG